MRAAARLLLFLLVSFLPASAFAVDGVVEINREAALQGGVTPGDVAGFPVTLSVRGSYRLTGDLLSNDRSKSLIEVTASDVSLDLNGFTVGMCLSGLICGTGSAITIEAQVPSFRIRNGRVAGGGGTCLAVGERADVRDLHVDGCVGNGIFAGVDSHLVGLTVSDAGSVGVSLSRGVLLESSVITGAGLEGVEVRTNALIVDSVIRASGSIAIGASASSSSTKGGYRGCLITQNGPDEVQPIPGQFLDLGGNLCGSDTVCP